MRLPFKIYFFKACENEKRAHIIFFPYQKNVFFCGISGIVSFRPAKKYESFDIKKIEKLAEEIKKYEYDFCKSSKVDFRTHYLGLNSIKKFLKASLLNFENPFSSLISYLKKEEFFLEIYQNPIYQKALDEISKDLQRFLNKQEKQINKVVVKLSKEEGKFFFTQIEFLKDLIFCISSEILAKIDESKKLFFNDENINQNNLRIYRKINLILNSIDKTEVRGRDSAGASLLFVFDEVSFKKIKEIILSGSLKTLFQRRSNDAFLKNNSIYFNDKTFSFCITYKTSSEIGSLGDNVKFLREQIKKDAILFLISSFESSYFTIISHTRWASVGAVSDANCHPIDNFTQNFFFESVVGKKSFSNKDNKKLIHICLNGDIDNYLELKKEYERKEGKIFDEITTDSKIIPLQIQSYLKKGHKIQEAFLMAVNDFEGSHAIIMHTDIAPGKIFIAQKGSGQTAFVSISENEYMISSEIYGLVEHSSAFIKLEGAGQGSHNSEDMGQILILDQNAKTPISDIKSIRYNANSFDLKDDKIQYTQITSRDIDRGAYAHYFLKEISESFLSFQKTISNYWSSSSKLKETIFSTNSIPISLISALKKKKIKKIFFIGQGTAGVAADACSYILQHYLVDEIKVASLKASEFSGYTQSAEKDMSDILLVAITQSGTTADTNYTVDFAKKHKAYCLAIVNKRDSDITFKVDGVIYTSTGRDVEMSVASTKAFYSQIAAGAMLSLHIASILKIKSSNFINLEINELLKIPSKMLKVLENQDAIKKSAYHYATKKRYWATVGSGANKVAADEIRIKLSELCYRTISSDYVEDKKHIDLSAEPLIIVCAAGTKSNVLSDIKKDVAIFNAHKAAPIVIGDHEDAFFKKYASSFFCIPKTKEHFAPILNTLCGHLWGYYAALSMHEFSTFIDSHKKQIQKIIEKLEKEKDIYEIILEESFKTQIAKFYEEFMEKKNNGHLPVSMGHELVLNIVLLLKYLSGKLSILDFKIDFGIKGTPFNMIKLLFEFLDASISEMMRPVDAIKHQAKTVTVGTSRASEEIGGIIFDYYQKLNFSISQLSNQNVIVLKNIQNIIGKIDGSILYKIENLNILGEQTKKTKIIVVKKLGSSRKLKSRVENSNELKGTKSIIVREKNVFVGKGISDKKNIVIIPIISSKSNFIEYILLLSVSFTKEFVPLFKRIKALGGKYQRIKNIVQEKNIKWKDKYLDKITVENLFGESAEKSAEEICKII